MYKSGKKKNYTLFFLSDEWKSKNYSTHEYINKLINKTYGLSSLFDLTIYINDEN